MYIFSQALYRKLTYGVVALPVIMFCFCRLAEYLSAQSAWLAPIRVLLTGLFIGSFFWALYFAFKVATLEKNAWQFVFILLLAFGPLIGAFLAKSEDLLVFVYSFTLLSIHALIAWPICFYWTIQLVFAKTDPEAMK